MPLGFQRLNEKTQRPSTNINFIKPLPGPDHDTAHDFLCRIAAISQPITRSNYINVMSLEEFPPNREFWGRNFNNGECIQLVLKSPSTGQWLSFRFVQKVFMHELAHVHQMNHGKEFWKLRNKYAEELETLWGKGFVGEGLWGRGRTLYTGQIADGAGLPNADSQLVAATCGGTFRGFRGKRKRKVDKPKESYKEQKERRIKKKFGEGGQSLGDDDEKRTTLEKGKKVKGKPRVAGSNRGRDLRAAAALARFEAKTEPEVKPEDQDESDYETDYGSDFDETTQAKDTSGKGLLDASGKRLIKVCGEEDDAGDENARREMEELGGAMGQKYSGSEGSMAGFAGNPIAIDEADISTASESEGDDKSRTPSTSVSSVGSVTAKNTKTNSTPVSPRLGSGDPSSTSKYAKDLGNTSKPGKSLSPLHKANTSAKLTPAPRDAPTPVSRKIAPVTTPNEAPVRPSACPVCSLENEAEALTCMACAHVLQPDRLRHHWKCVSDVCKDSVYINSADVGVCGLCGSAKS